ncbi:SCO family protein [Salsuginibacillus kocurii]|uniref:SCO family protein n=1 Tax=Salsuginibacillus kocurii TaxID=427078 RepID=UPI00035CC374|nr:SCO family protein [Salsuginibacillus kocurii]
MQIQGRLIIVGCMFLFLSGCGWLYESESSGDADGEGQDLTEADLYVEDFSFTDEQGDEMGLEDLEGSYWLANMVFTRCPSVCNLMSPNMSSLQAELEEEDTAVEMVSFTVDPEFDTPERLKDYGESYNANLNTWHFLTGYTDDEIKTFAEESFNSVVQAVPEDDDIMHATSFFLVNPNGQVVRSYDGLESDTDAYVEEIEALVNEE